MGKKQVRFAELLTLHVNNRLQEQFASGSTLNPEMLRQIRDCTRNTISEVFAKSSHQLTSNAINWLANQYFKSIQLGTSDGKKSINDLIVLNDYPLSEMPFSDIELMKNMFNEMPMFTELDREYRRRITS